ncbi:molybdopterin oxidoreductase [Brucella cytisi]|uniref:Molybdopterin oxidoreductase n=2 Tax=Brucella cytisi TaxID=407152 RepID=A0A1J6HKE3_9HYPH|nr:molybdopterin oxidoreductase [Brucella cytisi]
MARKIPGYCTLCRSRCGSMTVIERKRLVGVEPFGEHPTGGALCAKGRAAPELVYSPRRLKKPLRRTAPKGARNPGWTEISWDEALTTVAERLDIVRKESGAEAVVFAMTTPSGTPIVDSSEWIERFVRCFGSPNLLYAVEVCGWHKDYAHALTFGRGIGFPDYEQADTIVLWGHNPARTWLAQASRIADAKQRGAKVAVIDPKPDGSGQMADLWLRIRPGADAALAMAVIRHLIATETFDRDFVAHWTNAPFLIENGSGRFLRANDVFPGGDKDAFVVLDPTGQPRAYDTRHELAHGIRLDAMVSIKLGDGRKVGAKTAFQMLREAVEPYDFDHVSDLTWLDTTVIRSFAGLFEGSPRLAYHSWTGVGQHSNASAIERAIATLYALTGACDRSGGNVWPVAPPTRTVNDLSLLPSGQLQKALGIDRLPLGPPSLGWITARDFERSALHGDPYKVRALMSWGSNLVGSQSNTERNLAVLHALDFHVHVDMFMNPTAEMADIILPANMPWEREALKIGFEITQEAAETIQFRPSMLSGCGESRADYAIAFDLAQRLGFGEKFFEGDIRRGWNYQLEPLGVNIADLALHPSGRRFPQPFGYAKYATNKGNGVTGFKTHTRRAELYSETLLQHGYNPLPEHVEPVESPLRPTADPRFPLVLTTAKSGWFIHTSLRHVASLRKKSPDPAVELSEALANKHGLEDGDWALVETPNGQARLRVRINNTLDDRVVVAEFGWWEDCQPLGRNHDDDNQAFVTNLNAILNDRHSDPVSGSVPLRATSCQIHALSDANKGRWTGSRTFVVSARRHEADDVIAIEFVPRDAGALPDFLPGQHVEVTISGVDTRRSYSLTGTGDAPSSLSLGIRRTPSPAGTPPSFSQLMHHLNIGDEIKLSQPSGVFNLPLGGDRPIVFIAAGIGITPFMSHLETLAHRNNAPEVHLLYGCRHGGLHPYAQRLQELKSRLSTLKLITFYSSPRSEDKAGYDYDRAGRIDIGELTLLLSHRPLIYLCGSPQFISDTKASLVELGVFAFDIFAEAFVSPAQIPPQLTAQEVRIAGSNISFVWKPDAGSILDAAHASGVQLPSGCRVGQCESCSLTVISGEVAHLSAVDVEPGHCLACVAVPLRGVTLARG